MRTAGNHIVRKIEGHVAQGGRLFDDKQRCSGATLMRVDDEWVIKPLPAEDGGYLYLWYDSPIYFLHSFNILTTLEFDPDSCGDVGTLTKVPLANVPQSSDICIFKRDDTQDYSMLYFNDEGQVAYKSLDIEDILDIHPELADETISF